MSKFSISSIVRKCTKTFFTISTKVRPAGKGLWMPLPKFVAKTQPQEASSAILIFLRVFFCLVKDSRYDELKANAEEVFKAMLSHISKAPDPRKLFTVFTQYLSMAVQLDSSSISQVGDSGYAVVDIVNAVCVKYFKESTGQTDIFLSLNFLSFGAAFFKRAWKNSLLNMPGYSVGTESLLKTALSYLFFYYELFKTNKLECVQTSQFLSGFHNVVTVSAQVFAVLLDPNGCNPSEQAARERQATTLLRMIVNTIKVQAEKIKLSPKCAPCYVTAVEFCVAALPQCQNAGLVQELQKVLAPIQALLRGR